MKRLPRSLAALAISTVMIGFMSLSAFAGDNEKDPPGRVARLKYASGQVSFQPGGENDWVDATLNRPMTTADRVWTDKDSKAELHLGSSAIRMDSETSLTLSNLTDNTVQVELDQGVLNLHVRKLYDGEIYEVDTPNVAFTLLKPGDYRFEVNPDNDTTTVIVRKGKGEGNGDGRGVQVESGEMARFEHGNTLMHEIQRAPGPDGFDDWCRVRDQREDRGYESARYVSDDVIGYEDLDDNGYWRTVPAYGSVWVPRHVVAGWAPYRYGHWVWVEPWGWTWVDDAPWGFAPFHYGRWVSSSYGWAWCPGPRVYRPVYAPALVAWFGGPHFGVGVTVGNVGWVPLGWGEPYYPAYRVSTVYVRNVNITNTRITNITYVQNNYTTIINNHGRPVPLHGGYMNARAVSVVSNDAMIHSQRVDRVAQPWHGDLRNAEFTHSPGVVPDRRSVLGAGHEARVPQGLSDRRQVVSKMAPPDRPSRFEDRRPLIEKNGGMPVDRNVDTRGMRVPEERRPVNVGEGPRGRDNRGDANSPAGQRMPDERKPMNVGEGGPGRDNNRHAVPRPPVDRKQVTVDEGSPATRNAVNDSPKHSVPRPPVDRPTVSTREDRNAGGRNTDPQQGTPRVPEERKPAYSRDDSNAGGRNTNPQQANPRVPEERKPMNAGDEGRGNRPAPEQRRTVDAEARPNNAPTHPEREARPVERRNNEERHEAPKREEAPKQKPQEREQSKPATPAGNMAWSNGPRSIPRPTDYRPASSYSRREVASASYGREYGASRATSSVYTRGAYSDRSAGSRVSSTNSSRQPSHASSGGSSSRSSGGENARHSAR